MNFWVHVWAAFHMLLDLVEWHLEFAPDSTARTDHFPEQADFLVAFQLRKIEHLTTAFVLTLVLDLLDQPGGDQGGGVAQVDHAGGALGHLLPGLLSYPVSAGAADNVTVATNRYWSSLSGGHQAHWALDQPLQLLLNLFLYLLLLFRHVPYLLLHVLLLLLKSQNLLILLPPLFPEIFKLHISPSNKYPRSLWWWGAVFVVHEVIVQPSVFVVHDVNAQPFSQVAREQLVKSRKAGIN